MVRYISLLLLVIVVACQKNKNDSDFKANEAVLDQETYEACLIAKDLIYNQGSDYGVSCYDRYLHYSWKGQTEPANKQLQIASFNLWHLGDGTVPGKDIDLVASIMNRWDLVAALEIMKPSAQVKYGSHHKVNKSWWEYSQTDYDPEIIKSISISSPKYLELLNKLRLLDESWSLILSPSAMGSSVNHQELTGFYYRGSVVKPKVNSYCGGYACYLDLYGSGDKVARYPLVADFKSGDFSFTALAYHARFDSMKASDITPDIADDRILSELDFYDKNFNPDGALRAPMAQAFRFVELNVIMKEIDNLKNTISNPKIILMGDFNLEQTANNNNIWDEVLGSHKLYVEDLSSISETNRYASAYDHFVFDPDVVPECAGNQARTVDFTDSSDVPEFAQAWRERQLHINEIMSEEAACLKLKFNNKGVNRCMTELNLNKLYEKISTQLTYNEEKPYLHYKNMISDHLPVVLPCSWY